MAARPKSQWPLPGGWLDRTVEPALRVTIVERAFCDLYIAEDARRPNRSGRIDTYLRRAKVDESEIVAGHGYWCAAWAGAVWEDAGAMIPPRPGYADCDVWVRWGKQQGLWSSTPVVGAAALYGVPGNASHIGLVIRVPLNKNYPYLFDIEGNTTLNGFSSNGICCQGKDVNLKRLLGYVHPKAA